MENRSESREFATNASWEHVGSIWPAATVRLMHAPSHLAAWIGGSHPLPIRCSLDTIKDNIP